MKTHPLATAVVAVVALTVAACQQTQSVEPTPELVPEPPQLSLWEAAVAGDIGALEGHRAAGANLNALQPDTGITALVGATVGGQATALEWLLDNGADVNGRSGDGNTAMHAAAFMGATSIALRLLEAGIDVGASNDNGQTVWQTLATDWQTTEAVADLFQLTLDRQSVEAGRAEIGALLKPYLDSLGAQNIWIAALTGSVDAIKGHIDGGADINQRNADGGATLLSMAALFGHADVAALLIEAGAEIDARNYGDGSTALHAAAFVGRAEVVKLLLDHGADASAMSDNGGTPLATAQLDWPTTQYVAGLLQVPVDEASTMAGKAAVVELLQGNDGR